jgi:UDP-glucose 4-epimerase
VADTVEALVRLQNCPAAGGQIFNIGSTEEISILDLARRVNQQLGTRSEIQFVPYREAYGADFDDMRRRKPLVDKLEKFVGFRPATPLGRTIELTADAFRSSTPQ